MRRLRRCTLPNTVHTRTAQSAPRGMTRSAMSHFARKCGLVYFSPVPYDSYAQRPHFMVSAFVDAGFEQVLWIDPYPTRLPTPLDLRRLGRRIAKSGPPGDARVRVLSPTALPIEPIPMSEAINHALFWGPVRTALRAFAQDTTHCVIGIGRPSKLAEWTLSNVPHAYSFVDVLDNFPAFYSGLSRLAMQSRLRSICRKVSDAFCSSWSMAERLRPLREDIALVPNGHAIPLNTTIASPVRRACIAYVGSIAPWFDWPLVCALARGLPEVVIRILGPEHVGRPSELPVNVELRGAVPQADVTEALRGCAVGLIPFHINELTDGVDPIKFYEYRGMGMPVWSTSFGDMRMRDHREGVTHVHAASDWRHLWARALANRADMRDIAAFRAATHWRRRFEPMIVAAMRLRHRGTMTH